ncbi:MAG TPA: PDR/VanB family oxidoreductase [Streptosporangiaceae bacterium]
MPRDLYGRDRPDRFLRNLTAFLDGYRWLVEHGRARTSLPAAAPVSAQPVWRTMVVAGRVAECADVVSLRLTPAAGSLPRWQPGAHLRVELPSGLIRHYSLCGDPRDRESYTIAVRRLSGAGSAEVHSSVDVGSALRVLGPRNGFAFAAEPALLFIAGGIGITPLLPMVTEAAALGLDWRLVYRGRSADTMPFADQVRAVDPARVELLAGPGHNAADLVRRAPQGAAVYCCGPRSMIDEVRSCFAGALHFERFTPAPIADGEPFTVSARGKEFAIPSDRSILDVLLDADRSLPYSCRQGFCGTCRQRVLRGTADHRDRQLTDAERASGDVLICVSRAAEGERLVLDL